MDEVWAIVVAAGGGHRFGTAKQFEALGAVMEAFAGRSALEAAAWPVIELVEAGLELD